MNVIFLSPGYPAEMPYFVRGLARSGARVFGVAEQPEGTLEPMAREHLSGYLQVPSLWDEADVVERVRRWTAGGEVARVEAQWEPCVILAARLREALGAPGMTVDEVVPFRDKDLMKQRVAAAGIRTPRHRSATTNQGAWEAVEAIGYPVILKPIAGAGSQDTYRVGNAEEMAAALERMGHVDQINVEEFIEGEELTFDTICVEGEIVAWFMAWYRQRPLVMRTVEWISPQTVYLRDVESEELAGGREMGRAVLKALGFRTGFTHMEWYRKPDGEVVFGEIAARAPGAHHVDVMNYSCDADFFTGWAEAVVSGTLSQPTVRKYNAAVVFKRAQGWGRIQRIEGLDRLRQRYGDAIAAVNLLPIGAPRRNWVQTMISDGWLVVRHPELRATLEVADAVGSDLHLFAG